MKKLNSYFPLWLLLIVPPILLLTLAYNFITVSLGLLITLIIINKRNAFKNSFKELFKLWGVTLILDVFTLIMIALPELFYGNDFMKENFITPLETNPYGNIFSFIYVILIFLVNILFIILFVNKIIIKKHKIEGKKKNTILTILVLCMLPYLFFIPSNMIVKTEYNSLSEYKGTNLKNKAKIATLLKNLKVSDNISSYVIDTHAEPYTLHIYTKDIELNHQMLFERDAASIFNVVDDVNEVVFYLNDKGYKYTINTINKIFKDVKSMNLFQIYERYKDSKFEDYTYLGRLDKYDAFDTSEFCELEKQLLFQMQGTNFYLKCSSVEKIILYNKNESMNIKEALDKKLIDEYTIMNSTIDTVLDGEDENNN